MENVNGKSPGREEPEIPLPVSSWNKKALIQTAVPLPCAWGGLLGGCSLATAQGDPGSAVRSLWRSWREHLGVADTFGLKVIAQELAFSFSRRKKGMSFPSFFPCRPLLFCLGKRQLFIFLVRVLLDCRNRKRHLRYRRVLCYPSGWKASDFWFFSYFYRAYSQVACTFYITAKKTPNITI